MIPPASVLFPKSLFTAQQTVFIIGGGPSVQDTVIPNLLKLRHCPTITVNEAWRLLPESNVHFSLDPTWWQQWGDALAKEHRGYKATAKRWRNPNDVMNDKGAAIWNKKDIRNAVYDKVFTTNDQWLCGENSGHAAINLAWQLGARTVVLCGFDMQPSNGRFHWHEDNTHPQGTLRAYKHKYIPAFEALARQAPAYGLKIYNASPINKIAGFEHIDIRTCFEAA